MLPNVLKIETCTLVKCISFGRTHITASNEIMDLQQRRKKKEAKNIVR